MAFEQDDPKDDPEEGDASVPDEDIVDITDHKREAKQLAGDDGEDEESDEDSDEEEEDEEEESEESEDEEEEETEEEEDEEEEEEEPVKSTPKVKKSKTPKDEIDISTIPLEKILEREDAKRALQSAHDKGAEAEKKRQADARKREQERLDALREEQELDELLETENKDELFNRIKERREAERAESEEGQKWVKGFAVAGAEYYRTQFADLGEETLDRIFAEMEDKPILELGPRLAEERLTLKMEKLMKERNSEEDEADEAEEGRKRRDKKAQKKTGPVENISKSKRSKSVRTERTEAQLREAYADGEVAFEELPEDLQKKLRGY